MAAQGPPPPENRRATLPRLFARFARWFAETSGHPVTFSVAAAVIVTWLALGPRFAFSDTWQLTINTGCAVATFLMVFLIQNTQNRESKAMQLKMDEILRSIREAHNAFLNIEELTLEELDEIKAQYGQVGEQARDKLRRGEIDTGIPRVRPPGSDAQ